MAAASADTAVCPTVWNIQLSSSRHASSVGAKFASATTSWPWRTHCSMLYTLSLPPLTSATTFIIARGRR